MVHYGAEKNLDPKILREKIQTAVGSTIPEGFLVVVAAPYASVPVAYLYKKRRDGLEIHSFTQIRVQSSMKPFRAKETVLKEKGGTLPSAAPPPPLPNREAPREAVQSKNEITTRSSTVATVSEAAESFSRLIQTIASRKKDFSPGSWFIEITGPFIELKPHELETLSQGVTFDPSARVARSEAQERILGQIQSEVINRLASSLKKYPIPEGQIVNVKWREPLPAYLRVQEENGVLQLSVSGTHTPTRSQAFRREDLQRGMTIDIGPSNPAVLPSQPPPFADPPPPEKSNELPPFSPYEHLMGFLAPKREAGNLLQPVQIACESPSSALDKLGSLLDYQKGKFLPPRPIHLNLMAGKPDKDFVSNMVDFLRDHPLINEQEIQLTWNEPEGRLKVWSHEREIRAELSGNLENGKFTYSVVLKADGQKMDNWRYQSGPR